MFHFLNCRNKINQVWLNRAEDEVQFRSGKKKLNEAHHNYTQMFVSKLKALEAESQELREKQSLIKENYDSYTKQLRMYADLVQVLEAKLRSTREPEREVDDEGERIVRCGMAVRAPANECRTMGLTGLCCEIKVVTNVNIFI